jgi:inner membrane protein involved in colicin E2 resistance
LITERTSLREQAVASVARGWGGRQLLTGPVLAIPVTLKLDDGHTQTLDWYVLPESLNLDVEVTVQQERRRLGVYPLMGLALSVFFLLLLALAEHIGFRFAYLTAALALCALGGVANARRALH